MMGRTVTVERVELHRDARGWVFEPIGPGEFAAQHNAHLVLSEPGAIRGNHLHPKGEEIVVVVGPGLVRYREGEEVRDVMVPEQEAYRFRFPAGVAHAMQNTGSGPQMMVAFNTEAHDRGSPDVVRVVLIEG